MILVDEGAIIRTYPDGEQFSCQRYAAYLQLVKENPSFGYKRCAKALGLPPGRVRWWHTKGKKKALPLPLKAVEKLKDAGLLPFTDWHKDAGTILNMLGVLFGDGGIDKRFNALAFISSDLGDVRRWEKDLLAVFPFAAGKTNLCEGGEWGHSYNIRTFDRSVVRFFAALGAPVGNKVTKPYRLPAFLFDVGVENKAAFLDGLLASELGVPRFRGIRGRENSGRFTNFSLGLSKVQALEAGHLAFLSDLKELFASVGVTTTPNTRKAENASKPRKDGQKSHCYSIFLQTHFDKVLRFNEQFPLRYASGKKERLEREIRLAAAAKAEAGCNVLYR